MGFRLKLFGRLQKTVSAGDQSTRSADAIYERYCRACELKDTPDRTKILASLHCWLTAIGYSDWAVLLVENARDMKNAITAANDLGSESNPVTTALYDAVGRSDWQPAKTNWNTHTAYASLAAEPAFAAAIAEPGHADEAAKNAWATGLANRNPSRGHAVWGYTGPSWSFYGAHDLSDYAQNAFQAAAGGRPTRELMHGLSSETKETLLQKWLPLFEAFEAGALVLWIGQKTLYAAVFPKMLFDDTGRIHCDSGPAFFWLDDIRAYYWHGVYVPEYVIMEPTRISIAEIDSERNAEVCRVMIERYKHGEKTEGTAAYMRDAEGE